MKKTYPILVFTLAFLGTGIITAATKASREPYVDSETQALLALKSDHPTDPGTLELLNKTLPIRLERDRQINERIDLSQREKEKLAEEKRASHEAHLRLFKRQEEELKSHPPQPLPPQSWEMKGVHQESLFDGVDQKAYHDLNYWTSGRKENTELTPIFSAGFKYENPLQGVVEYHMANDSRKFDYYPSPEATGPLKIMSEKDGVLTLESQSGSFEKHDIAGEWPAEEVRTPGGKTYFFDTRSFKFLES